MSEVPETSEIPPLQVKSGRAKIQLTFKNDILSIAENDIPSRNILEVKLRNSPLSVDIRILVPYSGGKKLRLRNYIFDTDNAEQAALWVELVKNAVYKNTKPNKHLKFFINPLSGSGKAVRIFNKNVKPILDAANCTYDVSHTERVNHAKEIVTTLDLKNYDAVIGVGGDGTVHEIINGILSREDAMDVKIPIGVIPTGSGNALYICLHGETYGFSVLHSTLTIIKGVPMEIDICSVTQGDERYYSFLTQSYGLVADCDLGTENIRWMGKTRFTVGFIQAVLEGRRYGCELAVKFADKNQTSIKDSYNKGYSTTAAKSDDNNKFNTNYKFGTVNDPIPEDWEILNDDLYIFFAGKVPWVSKGFLAFPYSLPSDGLMDVMIVKRDVISKTKFLAMINHTDNGTHVNYDEVEYYKIEAFRLTPKNRQDGYISIDGEKVPFKPFQVEVHQKLITVLSVDGKYCRV